MDRLQKKCFLASAGVHGLLALILLVGPAFQSASSKTDSLPVLDFIPAKTVDALVSGGGNPQAQAVAAPAPQPQPPAPAPLQPPPPPQPRPQPQVQPLPQPAPQPERRRVPEPELPKEVVKETKPPKLDPDSLELSKDRKGKKLEISTKLVTRNSPDPKAEAKAHAEAQAREEAREEARQFADARRRLARQIGRMAENLGDGVAGATTIELKGPGGGGVPYANFLQAVKSVYERAWVLPDGVTDEDATAVVSVTIARDGTVVSARITRSSGNVAVDRSVQATLDRVKYAAPLPDDAKENERTVGINFNVKAKKALG